LFVKPKSTFPPGEIAVKEELEEEQLMAANSIEDLREMIVYP